MLTISSFVNFSTTGRKLRTRLPAKAGSHNQARLPAKAGSHNHGPDIRLRPEVTVIDNHRIESFLSERLHRIEAGGACGGEPCGEQASRYDHDQTGHIGDRISDAHDLGHRRRRGRGDQDCGQ